MSKTDSAEYGVLLWDKLVCYQINFKNNNNMFEWLGSNICFTTYLILQSF